MSRQISQQITIHRAITDSFLALITPSSIRQWWQADRAIVIPERDGIYVVTWGDDEDNPEYISAATISNFEQPHRLRMTDYKYHSAHGGLPFEASMETEFNLEEQNGSTQLTVVQSGFPDESIADEFYQACVTGWTDTLQSIKRMLEED